MPPTPWCISAFQIALAPPPLRRLRPSPPRTALPYKRMTLSANDSPALSAPTDPFIPCSPVLYTIFTTFILLPAPNYLDTTSLCPTTSTPVPLSPPLAPPLPTFPILQPPSPTRSLRPHPHAAITFWHLYFAPRTTTLGVLAGPVTPPRTGSSSSPHGLSYCPDYFNHWICLRPIFLAWGSSLTATSIHVFFSLHPPQPMDSCSSPVQFSGLPSSRSCL